MMSDGNNPNPNPTPEPTPTPSPEPTPSPTPPPEPSLLSEPKADEPVPFAPDKLTLPEGFEKNDLFNDFSTLATESKLPHDVAQKLIDLYSNGAKASAEASLKGWQETNAKWQEEVKADKEVGGANLSGVLQTISKVVDNPDLTDPKFREALDFTGAGNHPAVVRTLAKWAKALSEGTSVAGEPASNQGARPSIADAIYPGGPRQGNSRMES
jgi:hypothetical protein